jgi:hypothetical protein
MAAAKLRRLLNFHLLFYYMTEAPSSNPVAFLFPPLLLDACGVLDAAAAR